MAQAVQNNAHFDFLPVLVDRDLHHGAYPIVVDGVFDDAPYRSVPVCSAPSQRNRFLSQKKKKPHQVRRRRPPRMFFADCSEKVISQSPWLSANPISPQRCGWHATSRRVGRSIDTCLPQLEMATVTPRPRFAPLWCGNQLDISTDPPLESAGGSVWAPIVSCHAGFPQDLVRTQLIPHSDDLTRCSSRWPSSNSSITQNTIPHSSSDPRRCRRHTPIFQHCCPNSMLCIQTR